MNLFLCTDLKLKTPDLFQGLFEYLFLSSCFFFVMGTNYSKWFSSLFPHKWRQKEIYVSVVNKSKAEKNPTNVCILSLIQLFHLCVYAVLFISSRKKGSKVFQALFRLVKAVRMETKNYFLYKVAFKSCFVVVNRLYCLHGYFFCVLLVFKATYLLGTEMGLFDCQQNWYEFLL